MILLGELSLWIALLMAVWSAVVSYAGSGLRRGDLVASGERALYATFGFLVLAAVGVWSALLGDDFSLRYVASYSSANLPTLYKLSAVWAGPEGALLFWCLLLATSAALALFGGRRRNRDLMPHATAVLAGTLAFFIAATALGANPYERLAWLPPDGRGLDPHLQHPGMALHPPALYLGFVASAVPFAFAVAGLLARRVDHEWVAAVRRWSVASWFLLTVGIALGMWSAYAEPERGGYWTWAPAQNASLLPWLTGTALIHALVIQAKRGVVRTWSITLVVATFGLAVLGSLVAGVGMVASVPSGALSPAAGWFIGFLIIAMGLAGLLIATRGMELTPSGRLERTMSREAGLMYGNIVLVGIAVSVLAATLLPLATEAVRGTSTVVSARALERVVIPLGVVLLALTGVVPLMAWRRSSAGSLRRQLTAPLVAAALLAGVLLVLGMRDGYALASSALAAFVLAAVATELYNGVVARRRVGGGNAAPALVLAAGGDRRRYGGHLAHAGVAFLFVGLAGLPFRKQYDFTLAPGASFTATDPYSRRWTFTSQGISQYQELNRYVTALVVEATRDGATARLIKSEQRQHADSRGSNVAQPSTAAGVLGSPRQDVYLVLRSATPDEQAEVSVTFQPLVWWVWVGAAAMALGGLLVMWPLPAARRSTAGQP